MIYKNPSTDIKSSFKSFKIAWLFPNLEIVTDPAIRLRRYNLYKEFNKYGDIVTRNEMFVNGVKVNSIDYKYFNASYAQGDIDKFYNYIKDHFDIVVFFSVSEYDHKLINMLSSSGKKCIFDHSENVHNLPYEDAIMASSTAITCCGTKLATITESYLKSKNISKNIFVIRDSIESDITKFKKVSNSNKAVIMGGIGNVLYVANPLKEICDISGYDFVSISDVDYNRSYNTKKWTPYTWVDDMLQCDVALCFNDPINFPAKSNVKVTTAMALGLPVIANPIESYIEAIKNEYDGFIANSKEDWIKYLNLLKSPEIRATIGLRAQNSAFENYNIQKICIDYFSMITFIL